ncbi:unnamed protein product [Rhizoctonia solani]|uniref:Uncharacterized protein n=1 Tax=Rhizoctonia solani TaxID=456999 RepID=A0A8H3H6S7_9AGAM|nr:unnamed protein product [Rhizoctonia solani]
MCVQHHIERIPGHYGETYSSWTPNCSSYPIPGAQNGMALRNNHALQMLATCLRQALLLMPYCPKHPRIANHNAQMEPACLNPMATMLQGGIRHLRRVKHTYSTHSQSARPAHFLPMILKPIHGPSMNISPWTRVSAIVPSYSLGFTNFLIHPGLFGIDTGSLS